MSWFHSIAIGDRLAELCWCGGLNEVPLALCMSMLPCVFAAWAAKPKPPYEMYVLHVYSGILV